MSGVFILILSTPDENRDNPSGLRHFQPALQLSAPWFLLRELPFGGRSRRTTEGVFAGGQKFP
jgi:hypothetical protein